MWKTMAFCDTACQICDQRFFVKMLIAVVYHELADFGDIEQLVQNIATIDIHKAASAAFRDDAHEYARRIQFTIPSGENRAKRFMFCGSFFHAEEASDLAGGKSRGALANQFVIYQSLCGHIKKCEM